MKLYHRHYDKYWEVLVDDEDQDIIDGARGTFRLIWNKGFPETVAVQHHYNDGSRGDPGHRFVAEYLARMVWQKHNGDIPEKLHVFHLNHDQTDNRLSNLKLMPKGYRNKG